MDNVIYQRDGKKLMIIDLDDISYGKPKGHVKQILWNNKLEAYRPDYTYDEKYGYMIWDIDYINHIIKVMLDNTLNAYDDERDEDMINKLDEKTKQNFKFIETKLNEIIGNYRDITIEDIDIINDKLDELKHELCDHEESKGGKTKRRKKKKTVKNKKKKYNKNKKTKKTK